MSKLITYRVLFFNQINYVKDSVRSALAQTYQPLQIIFSDDCSTDGTFDAIKRELDNYEGPHEITLNRCERNMGIGAHMNQVRKLTKGELTVCNGGDDYSRSDRVEKIYERWKALGFVSCSIYSLFQSIDDAGNLLEIGGHESFRSNTSLQKISDKDYSIFKIYPGCTGALTENQFEIFGDPDPGIIQNDASRQFRSALLGGVAFINEPLVYYRKTPTSLSRIGKQPYSVWKAKRIKYLESYLKMINQFRKDLELALKMGFISKEVEAWGHYAADRFYDEKSDELTYYTGAIGERIRVAMNSSFCRQRRLIAVAESIFPKTYHELRNLKQ